jgi:hypothetical protein
MKSAKEILIDKYFADEKQTGLLSGQIGWIVEAMEEYANQFKYDYSKICNCGHKRIGETWCCNQCGLPIIKENV